MGAGRERAPPRLTLKVGPRRWEERGSARLARNALKNAQTIRKMPISDPPFVVKRLESWCASGQAQVAVREAAVADGSIYNVAYEARLSETSYPGLSRAAHYTAGQRGTTHCDGK